MRLRSVLVASISVALLSSCAGRDSESAEIRMLDNSFAPKVIDVDTGETVRFVNAGRNPHNAIAADGAFSTLTPEGGNQDPGESSEITIDEPGVYRFYCSLHATQNEEGDWEGMVGTLVVGDAADPTELLGSATDAPDEWTGETRLVPTDYPTIQSAVDAADPGDLVLIEAGVYKEAVTVTTPGLVLRGTDRNEVILDGEFTRENGVAVTADGVAIENMTARNYTVNGFFWNGVTGYRGSYLTAIDDWVYGIYAFDSVDGLLSHSYASGSWDAGFYIGQCDPCNAVVTDVLAEYNGLGYSGTNSSGNIYIVNSEWRNNIGGIAPNTLDSELLPPANNVVVAGNYVHDNGDAERAPHGSFEWANYGNGVVLAGARDSIVRNNVILDNAANGVIVFSMLDANLWISGGNEVRDNIVRGSGRADLVLGGPVLEDRSCFADNQADSTIPLTLGLFHGCDGLGLPLAYGMVGPSNLLGRLIQAERGEDPRLEHGEAPVPELAFESLPGGADAAVIPAVDVFRSLDFDPESIATPTVPDGYEPAPRRPVLLGVALDGGFWPTALGVLFGWVPLAVWVAGGIWALWKTWRSGRSALAKVVWSLVVVGLPALGTLLFVLAGNRDRSLVTRLVVAVGGFALWAGAVVGAFAVGGLL